MRSIGAVAKEALVSDLIIYMRQFPPSVPIEYLTLMPLCMPAECKIGNVVESYREYYKKYKQDIFSWKGRDKPFWIERI